MVAAMPSIPTRIREPESSLHCAECGGHCGHRWGFAKIPDGQTYVRLRCRQCDRWRWFDLGSGRMVDRPQRAA